MGSTALPLDSLGRPLPEPGWPIDRQAPGALELVRRFCNSTNRENGAERFDSAASVDAWLTAEGCAPISTDDVGVTRLIGLRSVVHRLVVANRTVAHDAAAWQELTEISGPCSLSFDFGVDRSFAVRSDGVERLIGDLALAVALACEHGSWSRLTACQRCDWVVYDTSKNRSAKWCSMNVCGGRHNAQQYRRRLSDRTAG